MKHLSHIKRGIVAYAYITPVVGKRCDDQHDRRHRFND